MADNNTTFTLKLKTEGMEGAEKQTQKIRDNLEAASRAAYTTSTKKIASSAAAQPTGRAGATAGISGGDVEMYNRTRGAAGAAGGSARDFADQARGLGGLVRLYATFAANVFAATAAFGALSRAMDTSNMVQGLDQLGASSGKALGTLSKKLVAATDGAVSLRDAMEATAKASSAGLDSTQILRLGEVAKKSSQALGLSMPDALSRLSRGISKIEPELLDELGIFVKIEDATTKYAKSLGRTVTSLSDYERRQAFANEVLAQAEQKFSAIKIDSNPYTKLLATLQNVAQTGLEVINKFLGPLAGVLAENSKAVGLLLGVIGIKLIGSALPALSQWRKGIAAAAIDAKKSAEDISEAYGAAFVKRWETSLNVPALQKQVKTAQDELSKLSKPAGIRAGSVERVATLGAGAPEKDIRNVNRLLTEKETRLKSLTGSQAAADVAQAKVYTDQKLYLEQLLLRTKALTDATNRLNTARETVQTAADVPVSPLSGEAARRRNVQDAAARANRLETLSTVATTTAAVGFSGAMKGLDKDIEEKGIKGLNKLRTVGTGAFISLATSVGIFVKSFLRFIPYVGIAIMAFELLDGFLSKNSKETEKFNTGLDTLKDSVKLVTNTVEELNKQDIGKAFSAESSLAKANALSEVSTSINEVSRSFFDAVAAASIWDKSWDVIFTFFGGGLQNKLSKNVAQAIDAAILALPKDAANENYQRAVREILKVEDLDPDTVKNAIKGLSEKDAAIAVTNIGKVTRAATESQKALAATLAEGSNGLKKIQEAQQALEVSFKDTSPLSNYANALVAESTRIKDALKNPRNALILLNEIVNDTSKTALFDQKTIKQLVDAEAEIKTLAADTRLYEQQIDDARIAKQKLKDVNLGTEDKPVISIYANEQERKDFNLLVDTINRGEIAVTLRTDLEQKTKTLAEKFSTISQSAFEKGIDITTKKFQEAVAKAQLTVQTAMLSGVTGPGRADIDTGLKQQQIELDKKQITTAFEQIQALKENTLATLALKNVRDVETQTAKVKQSPGPQQLEELARLEAEGRDISAQLNLVKKGLKATDTDFKVLGKAVKGASEALFSYFQSLQGAKGQLVGKEAESKAADIEGKLKKEQESFQIAQKQLQAKIDTANIERDIANTVYTIYGIENQNAVNAKISAENKAQELQDTKNRQEIENKLTTNASTYGLIYQDIAKSGKEATANQKLILSGLLQSVKAAAGELTIFDQGVEQRTKLKEVNDEILRQSSKDIRLTKDAELQDTLLKNTDDLNKARLDGEKQELDALIATNKVSEEYAAKRIAEIAAENQAIIYQSQLREATTIRDAAIRAATSKASQAQLLTGDPEAGNVELVAEQQKANDAYAVRTALLEAGNVSALRGIEITKLQSLETAKQNQELDRQAQLLGIITGIADTLSSAFGKTGQVLGTFVNALGDSVKTQMEYTAQREKLLKVETDYQNKAASGEEITSDDIERRAKSEKDLGKLTAKNARDEMVNNTKLVGSVKNMFKEKTAAYRLFNAVERAMNVYTLTMDVAKAVSGWTLTGQKVAQAQVEATAQAAPAGAGAAAQTPGPVWVKIAAGLAAFAFVMSLASGGGGGTAPMPGTSSVDRQEVQGTGMEWVDGKKVETGRGVFGDPEAKSDAIRKSLETISANTVDGLSYDNRVVSLLTSIDKSIGKAAVGLFGVKGLRTGTAFNTVEGTKSGGGLLGTGLFASKTSSTISDTGLIVKGTFRQLAGEIDGAVVQLYEDVTKTKKRWYGKTKSWTERSTQDVPEALQYINDVFSYSADLFVELGSQLGMGSDEVYAALDSLGAVDFEGSLRGLKGEDFENELQSLISNQLDRASKSIFGGIVEDYKEFGESATETVIRVLDQATKVTQALKNVGLVDLDKLLDEKTTTETITKQGNWFRGAVTATITKPLTEAEKALEKIKITDSLVKLAGGLENFVEQNKFYSDNFLTDAEKLAPVQKAVVDQLGKLGLGFVDTREEFKNVVEAIDVTTPAGQQLYNSLMQLAPGFAAVYKAADEAKAALSETEMSKKVQDQRIKMLELLGGEANLLEVTNIKRKAELDELAKYPKEQADLLVANQKYIYALEDEKALKTKLTQSLTTTITALKGSISTLENYRTALLGGDKSVLTPEQKYQQSQADYLKLKAVATGPAVTKEEIAAQTDAINKLPAAADKFLDNSRTMFASSDRYAQDYADVVNTVDTTLSSLTSQKSTAELQLEQLESSNTSLSSIADSSKTTAELLKDYFAAQEITAQTKSGSATGLTIVDTTTALPLVTPATTAPVPVVVDNQALVNELAAIKVELEKLRTEQAQQTGSIIVSNAEAVNNNAKIITEAVEEIDGRRSWKGRQLVNYPYR